MRQREHWYNVLKVRPGISCSTFSYSSWVNHRYAGRLRLGAFGSRRRRTSEVEALLLSCSNILYGSMESVCFHDRPK